jgi:hypothetical protein
MDRRSEPRYPAFGPAEVTFLGDNPVLVRGRLLNCSGRGMRLWLPQAAPIGAPVRVDVEGAMFLGEVCYCNSDGDGYAVGFQLEHVLSMSEELVALMRSLKAAETQPVRKTSPAAEE